MVWAAALVSADVAFCKVANNATASSMANATASLRRRLFTFPPRQRLLGGKVWRKLTWRKLSRYPMYSFLYMYVFAYSGVDDGQNAFCDLGTATAVEAHKRCSAAHGPRRAYQQGRGRSRLDERGGIQLVEG